MNINDVGKQIDRVLYLKRQFKNVNLSNDASLNDQEEYARIVGEINSLVLSLRQEGIRFHFKSGGRYRVYDESFATPMEILDGQL